MVYCWFYPSGTMFTPGISGAVRVTDVMVNSCNWYG